MGGGRGTSLAVTGWLELHTSMGHGVQSLDRELRPHMLRGAAKDKRLAIFFKKSK